MSEYNQVAMAYAGTLLEKWSEIMLLREQIQKNILDNRKDNLRFTNNPNNSANRKSANSNNKTGVRNVHLINRYGGKQVYLVQIMRKGEKFVWEFGLDEFDEACIFAEMKRQEIFGEYAGES